MTDAAAGTRTVVGGALGWLAVAVLVGASGWPQTLRPPMPQLILATLTLLTLLAVAVAPSLRRWTLATDPRTLVALHVTRVLAGAYFLFSWRRGELPYAFAVPGGIGDIIVGLLALGLLTTVAPWSARGRWLYAVWNVLGLIDILFVVATAVRIALRDPDAMAPLLRLPLSVLPLWLVPLIIASHIVIGLRLARAAR